MSLKGFEPPTHGLEGRCSIQLSYRLIHKQLDYLAVFAVVSCQRAIVYHRNGNNASTFFIFISLLFPDKEQVMGIEPTYLAWKASVLPLNYTCTAYMV